MRDNSAVSILAVVGVFSGGTGVSADWFVSCYLHDGAGIIIFLQRPLLVR